jgi:hypothetical protein
VIVAAGQPCLDEERAELGPVESEPGGPLGDFRAADVDRRGVVEDLFLDAVAVEPGEHDQLERHRGRRQTARLEVACVQLDMGPAHVRQWFEMCCSHQSNQSRSWVVYACRVPGEE